MNLTFHSEKNENAWSAATTTNARRLSLDSRRICIGGNMKKIFHILLCMVLVTLMVTIMYGQE